MHAPNLLSWPPVRLVRESVLNYNLRHPDGPVLDAAKSPWEDIVPVIYAFVRHELTDYDDDLRTSTAGAYDEATRNRLAASLNARTRTACPWLKSDPRPFPVKGIPFELDEIAARLADLRTFEYHVSQVLRETQDIAWRKELKARLTRTRERIARLTHVFDSDPPPSPAHVKIYSRPTSAEGAYDWFGFFPKINCLNFSGFRCPECGASVMATKRAYPFGAGRKRFFASCFCLCIAFERSLRIERRDWDEVLIKQGLREAPPAPPESPGTGLERA